MFALWRGGWLIHFGDFGVVIKQALSPVRDQMRPVHIVAQDWHSELSLGRVLGTDEEAETEGNNRDRPRRDAVTAPAAYDPGDDGGHEPDATDPNIVVPHRGIYDFALFTILRLAETPARADRATRQPSSPRARRRRP